MVQDKSLGEKLDVIFLEKTGKSFKYMFDKYRIKLVWFLMKMNNDSKESEEIADEAFVKAFFEIEKYDKEKAGFSTWLFTIGRNIMIQNLKNNSKFQSIEQEYEGAKLSDFLASDDNIYNKEKEVIEAKKVQMIKNEISNLPPKYSTVLKMRELDGLTYAQIADVLDLNINTVKSQIKQGRELLVKKLEIPFKVLDEVGIY